MARRNAPAESSGRRDPRRTNASAAGPSSTPACLHQEIKSAYEFKYSRVVAPRFPPTVLAKSRHESPATSCNFLEGLAMLATVLISSAARSPGIVTVHPGADFDLLSRP